MFINYKNKFVYCLLFLFFSNSIYSQSISLYPKWGKKIKIYDTYDIENGSIIIKDSSLIKKIIPLKSLRKVKYSQKSYKSYGDVLLVSGKLILNFSLLPAVAGYPDLFYSYSPISSALILSGSILNHMGMRLGRKVIIYKLKGLNYINRELIFSSIFSDLALSKSNTDIKGEYYYEPHGERIGLPKANWFLSFSANNKSFGIEAWIKKHRLREKRFLQFAVPKK